mgnify:CR=1 FL=1
MVVSSLKIAWHAPLMPGNRFNWDRRGKKITDVLDVIQALDKAS